MSVASCACTTPSSVGGLARAVDAIARDALRVVNCEEVRRQGFAARGGEPKNRTVEVARRLVCATQATVARQYEGLRLDGQVLVENEHLAELPVEATPEHRGI